jgi:hypothetical protein
LNKEKSVEHITMALSYFDHGVATRNNTRDGRQVRVSQWLELKILPKIKQ